MSTTALLRIAHHEAAHALGYWTAGVAVCELAAGPSSGWCRPAPADALDRLDVLDALTTLLAGGHGEALAGPWGEPSGQDMQLAHDVLRRAGLEPSSPAARRRLAEADRRAVELVREHGHAVVALAADLARRGTMRTDDIARAVWSLSALSPWRRLYRRPDPPAPARAPARAPSRPAPAGLVPARAAVRVHTAGPIL